MKILSIPIKIKLGDVADSLLTVFMVLSVVSNSIGVRLLATAHDVEAEILIVPDNSD